MNSSVMRRRILNLALSAMFLALGFALPFLTGQIPQIGKMLLPMHLPVLLCGLICGWRYGMAVGFVLPLLRFAVFGMPPLFPTGLSMAFELAAYGFISGFMYNRSHKNMFSVYRALISSMLGGRIVWGAAQALFTGTAGEAFTIQMFLAGAFFNAVPGIILQLIFIPAIMIVLDHTGIVTFYHGEYDDGAVNKRADR